MSQDRSKDLHTNWMRQGILSGFTGPKETVTLSSQRDSYLFLSRGWRPTIILMGNGRYCVDHVDVNSAQLFVTKEGK